MLGFSSFIPAYSPASGTGRDGGTQYLVQWRCPAGCRADGRGLDAGLANLRAVAEADGPKVRPHRGGRCQSDQAVAAGLQLGRIPQADGGGQFDQMVVAIDISQSAYAVFFR
jgi:hypothetical protein